MEPSIALRATVGIIIILVAGFFAVRRVLFLNTLIRSGQPTVERTDQKGLRLQAELTEVLGQKKLLKWTVPGIAHVLVFAGFIVLGITVLEAFVELFISGFAFPFIGEWPIIRFSQDLFVVLVFIGIVIFGIIRLRQDPKKLGRSSRFFGSHTGGAWLVLFFIFNVVWTLLLYRGAKINIEEHQGSSESAGLSYGFASEWVGSLLAPLGPTANAWIETVGIWLHVGVILGFLLIVLHSKHLHVFTAPINVGTSRRPNALGPLLPMYTGEDRINLEDPSEDDLFGRGRVEDFTWKGLLDMATCTECGRCQSQCPAWNTEKPLSPKLMMMDLRDHAFKKAPYVMAVQEAREGKNPEFGDVDEEILATMPESVQHEVGRELVGSREGDQIGRAHV